MVGMLAAMLTPVKGKGGINNKKRQLKWINLELVCNRNYFVRKNS
jgi:hypothetical protein